MQARPTQKRKLDKVFVISPEGLGDSRWDKISRHLADYRPSLPKPQRISVNKYLLNFAESRIHQYIRDDRSLWQKTITRLKIWRGQAQQDDFSQYDDLFEFMDKPTATIFPGEVACTLAHAKIWQEISSANDVCLVLEDDAELTPDWLTNQIDWPEGCDFLHLWPSLLYNLTPVDDQFSRLCGISPEQVDESTLHNWVTTGYFITPQLARTLLGYKPMANIQVDEWLLNFMPQYAEFLTYNQQRIINLGIERGGGNSLVREPTGHQIFEFLSRFSFYAKCAWVWKKIMPAQLQRMVRKYRYERGHWWE